MLNKQSWVMVSKENGLPLICSNNYQEIADCLGFTRYTFKCYMSRSRKNHGVYRGFEFTKIEE